MNDFEKRLASLKSVLTCGICKKLCKDVIIIEECCHRFCKKYITRKISKEKWNVCPECNMDLVVAPLQKIRSDHQMQGIKDIFSSKRRELIELELIEKSKKDEPKKLAREDIYLNYSAEMLIGISPPPPAPIVVAISSRRKDKSISSIVNTTPLIDDQVSNQDNVSSSSTGRGRGSGRGRGRGRGRRRGISQNNANVVDMNNGDAHPGSLTIPLHSGNDTHYKQQVQSIGYAAEFSKNDCISKKNKSIEPLDEMNDLWEPLNKLVTKGDTLDNSKESVPKFISSTPLINLDD